MHVRWDDLVLVGRVARTHGHRGQVIVNPDDRLSRRAVRARAPVWIAARRRAGIDRDSTRSDAQGRPVLALDGVETMDAAEALQASSCECRRRRCSAAGGHATTSTT